LAEKAKSLEASLVTAFLKAVDVVNTQIPQGPLLAALETGSASEVLRVADVGTRIDQALRGKGIGPKEFSFTEAWTRVYQAGMQVAVEELANIPVSKALSEEVEKAAKKNKPAMTVGVQIALDVRSPESEAFIQTYLFDLIREVSQKTVEVIRAVILDGFTRGTGPIDTARDLRESIGLTATQSQAVMNFKSFLIDSRTDASVLREALSRELRDHRYDATLQAALNGKITLTRDQINKMATRYRERYRKYRAEMIARTETARAAIAGQNEVWRQALEQGLLHRERTRRVWLLAFGACDLCAEIPRANPDGVPLGQSFNSSDGPISDPPRHPHCRCGTGLKFLPRKRWEV